MCSRSGAWLSDARRDVPASQAPTAAATASPTTRQVVLDANHNSDSNSLGNKWSATASSIGEAPSTPSASPAVSELVDKGVVYLRERIFNRDSGKYLDI